MKLRVEEPSVELEGTHRVLVRSDRFRHPKMTATNEATVVLSAGELSCGGLLGAVEPGNQTVAMDKYLLVQLRLHPGDLVDVEPGEFPTAQCVVLIAPADYGRKALTRLVQDRLLGKPVVEGQVIPLLAAPLTGESALGKVAATQPEGIAQIGPATKLELRSGRVQESGTTYEDIGGLERELRRIREVVEYPIRHPQAFRQLGIVAPRGLILHGPPGTGKTLIAKALAYEAGATVHAIQGPELMSAWYGGSEKNLREIFEQAKQSPPAIILIDELDSIAPRRDQSRSEVERRLVATLLTLMDGLTELNGVIVIGTTNAVDAIDPALRRPGRFEHEIHIGAPDTRGRHQILAILTRRMPLAGDVDLDLVAARAVGFVGADLAFLCRESAYAALRRTTQIGGDWSDIAPAHRASVAQQDFEWALANVRPSAMREVLVEVPGDVSWESIGGLDEIKQLIVENVVYGLSRQAAFEAAGIKPAKGMLLYGPPGTGKTLLAKVVARESGANFIAIKGPEVCSKWFGESELRVRQIFAKAREVAPCVVFFDELDAIAPTRGQSNNGLTDTLVNQLLAEMDGIHRNDLVFVLGATNRAELIDPALLRPGRFDYQVHVPLPDATETSGYF